MRKTLTNCLLILAIVLAPLQAFSASFDKGAPCAMHQSGQFDLQSDTCPHCNDHDCSNGDCSADHCTTSHYQLSIPAVNIALPAGNPGIQPPAIATDTVSRSYPPLLRPPV